VTCLWQAAACSDVGDSSTVPMGQGAADATVPVTGPVADAASSESASEAGVDSSSPAMPDSGAPADSVSVGTIVADAGAAESAAPSDAAVAAESGAIVDAGSEAETGATSNDAGLTSDGGGVAVDAAGAVAVQAACSAFLAANQASLMNVTNVCSPTELALWNQDGDGTCLGGAFDNGALDDTSGSDTNKECEDLPATNDPSTGLSYEQLCLNELACELGEGAGLSTTNPPASGGVPNAFCGTSTSCSTNPTGACVSQFEAAFLGATPATISGGFAAGSSPGARADALIATLVTSHVCNEN
jgi:hypothetical protein